MDYLHFPSTVLGRSQETFGQASTKTFSVVGFRMPHLVIGNLRLKSVQIKFLKQKMKKVYQDELDIREYLEPDVNSSHQTGNDPREKEKLFFDITKNGPPVTPPKSQETDLNIVPPRKSRSHLI